MYYRTILASTSTGRRCRTYTHLFEGDLDEVMDRLDAHFTTESRPERVLAMSSTLSTEANPLADQGFCLWARQDSNLRLTDYESAALTN